MGHILSGSPLCVFESPVNTSDARTLRPATQVGTESSRKDRRNPRS